jgi:branched-chain amino acid transport system permease protein
MLSFGHAVTRTWRIFAIHAMNWIAAGRLGWPVSLLPLIGGAAGAFFGVIFGYLTTRRAERPRDDHAGIGEMMYAASDVSGIFRRRRRISGNRTAGRRSSASRR